ncbi:MAG: thioredoxin domain-containing protein [Kofleriaceae bacterium]|nr:thioredoxin domain-containing protein [Kofleriaceae bacterium]
MPNRLATESSPYLRQHQDNPVQWWPWGAEAFAEARRLDKPVFVSIGYAACHWCHVMAHESFEDAATAALMNELFVNVKVDREERPDVDTIYMNAIHVMGEGGGWPLSAWCTPDGKPYFLGTYFPPDDRFGRPGFRKVLQAMADAWRTQRDQVLENVEALMDGLAHVDAHYRRGAIAGEVGQLATPLLIAAGRNLVQKVDPKHGGLGGAPKFPSSSSHELLGRCGRLGFGAPAREAFLLWARRMADGGIYDHLGGGFARYAVDAHWLVPHFEKMLYDNAQLLGIYGDAVAMGATELARVVPETVAWLRRELQHPAGGLWSSQDADSEGEEGKFYVWTPAQIAEVLGPVDAIQWNAAYGVTAKGNFEHGTTVLSRVTARGAASEEAALDAMRARLFEARRRRVPPATDDKVLSGWNGLAVSGLLRAWRATGDAAAHALAVQVGEFLVAEMMPPDGKRVARVWHDGKRKLDGTLDDYAFVAAAMLDLAEATGDATWWARGTTLLTTVRELFCADVDGVVVFYMNADGADGGTDLLIHRPESHHDGAIPAGAAVAVEGLLRLGLVAGDAAALALAERYLAQRLGGAASPSPFGASRLFSALDLYLHGQTLVVTEGDGRDALLTAARRAYAPTLMIAGPWASAEVRDGKTPAGATARAFVCRGQTCSAPVTTPAALHALLHPDHHQDHEDQ